MSSVNGKSPIGSFNENNSPQLRSDEIAASSVRFGLAELERQTSKTLQNLESLRLSERNVPGSVVPSPRTTSSLELPSSSRFDTPTKVERLNLRTEVQKHEPGILKEERSSPKDIFNSLELLIRQVCTKNSTNNINNKEEDEGQNKSSEMENDFILPAIDEVSHMALLSHSVVAYLFHLERNLIVRAADQMSNDIIKWMNSLFRVEMMECEYDDSMAQAVVRLFRLVLMANYFNQEMLESTGYRPLTDQVCIYISEANPMLSKLQYACQYMGFPLNSIRRIPCATRWNNHYTRGMDCMAFAKQVQIDVTEKRKPLLLVLDISDSICGYVDDLSTLYSVCETHNIWIHASGHGLGALICSQELNKFGSMVDSMTLNIGNWLGIASVPILTLFRNKVLRGLERKYSMYKRLSAFVLWATLQTVGRTAFINRIQIALEICKTFYEDLLDCDGIKILSRGLENVAAISENNAIKPVISFPFDTEICTVVFQFDGNYTKDLSTSTAEEDSSSSNVNDSRILEKANNKAYYDRLNSWLGQILQRNFPEFNLHMIEHEEHGTSIRFCPFELSVGEHPPSVESMQKLSTSVHLHVDILRATVKHKVHFMDLVNSNEYLRLVELSEWAGMGGVRFVPLGWDDFPLEQTKTELNKLNIDLVESLKTTDSAFSMGEGLDGLICVRFGMVTHETDIEELLDLVVSVGKTVQENSRVLDNMSVIVKKGIETAMADLQRESEEKLWQEGIFRHVPVLGRMVNWWSPPVKETGIRGRSLNLTQGVVESTENIYKYHMQMSGTLNQTYPNKAPPTPLVQTSLKPSIFPYTSEDEIELSEKRSNLQEQLRSGSSLSVDPISSDVKEYSD